ncbi:MAG: glutamate synthase large subunit, partial [Pseudomonadota bacterium]
MTGLYRPDYEHDSCGFGLVAQMDGVASHALVHTAIDSLSRLTHRGAVAADGKTGDGCGLLLRTPDKHLRAIAAETGLTLARRYAVGMVFFNRDAALRHTAMQALVSELKAQDLEVAGWRRVPVDPDACGEQALASLPEVRQVFVNAPQGMEAQEFDRRLFIARRRAVKAADPGDKAFHVASLASRAILYKGLVMPHNLARFYTDLGDPRLESAIAVFHQRFSTNTWPEWRLAQPFRYLAHNGEINTIKSNRNWAEARSYKFHTPLIPDLDAIRPWVSATGSDSFSLDNMLEALLMGGMDLFRAMRLLIPPAWQDAKTMDPDLRAFFEYGSMHQEPWDGPAGIVLTDGRYAACVMDRNGLRPARYVITNDRHITLASEAGVNDHAPGEIVAKGRLQPGEMLAVDTRTGELLPGTEIDARLKARKPYRRWLERHAEHLDTASDEEETLAAAIGDTDRLTIYKKLFHITFEEKDQLLRVLAEAGQEAVGSMGDDTPLPVMSREIRSLYDSFRQQFAQVTNPPIDSLRERLVMSLQTCIGRERNLFEETPDHARRLVVDSPVLGATAFAALKKHPYAADAQHTLDLNYAESRNLETAIRDLCDQAVQAVRDGAVILILSDRAIREGFLPVHALLATGAVHHRLISEGLRCDANIVVETATARDPHHFAVLLGYGATAVYPYLAYATLAAMVDSAHIKDRRVAEALTAYRHGIDKGILKILSKMGISTVASYRGAQLFEAVGLADQVVEQCFSGTPSRLQGMGFKELEADQRQLARHAWHRHRPIMHGGLLKFAHKGEYHGFNPDVVHALHQAVEQQDYGKYLEYARLVNTRPHSALRDLLVFDHRVEAIDVNQVEPIEAILPRFETGAMSLGALSPEAHETLAVAMNRLGGRSNSGEGGEDAARFGTEKNSRIKQVASGRFGVTPEYLVSAEVLQIKIAQGAKPGEGGQLAGRKVNALIARLRHCNPGTPLISPPPHHDIYSIEDLAQLIFDL